MWMSGVSKRRDSSVLSLITDALFRRDFKKKMKCIERTMRAQHEILDETHVIIEVFFSWETYEKQKTKVYKKQLRY